LDAVEVSTVPRQEPDSGAGVCRRRGLPARFDTVAIMAPFFWWTMDFLLAGRVPWSKLLPSAIVTGIFYGGLGVFSRFYFSGTIISDSKTYGTIGAILGIMTWLIAIGAVIILGAVAGAVWEERKNSGLSAA
jgi:membrane protein